MITRKRLVRTKSWYSWRSVFVEMNIWWVCLFILQGNLLDIAIGECEHVVPPLDVDLPPCKLLQAAVGKIRQTAGHKPRYHLKTARRTIRLQSEEKHSWFLLLVFIKRSSHLAKYQRHMHAKFCFWYLETNCYGGLTGLMSWGMYFTMFHELSRYISSIPLMIAKGTFPSLSLMTFWPFKMAANRSEDGVSAGPLSLVLYAMSR